MDVDKKPSSDEIKEYLERLAPLLALGHWEFEVADDPLDAEGADAAFAQVDVVQTKDTCRFWFSPDCFKQEALQVTRTFVHELLHCHLEKMRWVMNDVTKLLGPQARDLADDSFLAALEVATDNIARSIVGMFPAPPKSWRRFEEKK